MKCNRSEPSANARLSNGSDEDSTAVVLDEEDALFVSRKQVVQ